MKKGMTSLTALLLTLLLALGGVAFSDGNVESPSLSDEEVITCEHEFMETLEYENGRSEFIPLNDWEHVFNAYAPAWEQCAKCGLKRSVGEKLYYTETNKHAFADGVCTDCGEASACPHDMKVLLYAQDSYTPYEQIDAATHRVTYTTTPYYRCLRCGEEWHEDSLQPQTVVQTEKHQFSEGPDGGWECYACGYVSECAHENTVEVYGWAQDISDYTPVDGYTHLVTGTRFWYEECADCGKRLSDDPVREEQANVVENHNIAEMDGLYCWDCGYCPNTEEELPVYSCDHTQTYERTITGNGYMPVEGTNTHIAASYITEQTVCANNLCQKIVSENTAYTPDSSAAPDYHTFAGGVCTVCGYACPHADTYEWYEPDYDASTYTPVDAWTHTYAEHGTLQTVCENCGATVSEKEEVRTGTESHAYFDGVCDWCGVENACPHDLTTVDYIWDEPTYVKIDENTHKMAYDAEGYITCLRCGETVGTTPVRHVEMIEEHSFYEGECYCGATCEVVQCDHANRAEVWDPEDDEVVELTGTDVYNHTGVFERYFYPMCVDCGERFYDEGHWETVTGTSAHYFDFALSSPGVGCMVCGYVPGAEADKFVCEHEETMTQTVSGEEYRPVEGSNAHILTRYTVEQTVCTSNPWRCGQILAEKVISSTPVEGATEEIHTFDADGVCTVCGYACPHADTYEWYEPDYDASTYTPVDAWTHTYAEHGTLQTVCENCGATVSEKEEVRTGTESHAYFDGVCDWCGVENACPHDLTTVDYIWDEPTYVKIDENTHKMAYDAEGYITCLRCGETVGTTPVRHVEMIEEHSFYEGECYCGATCEVVQCDHANRAEVWDPEDDEVVELTGTDVYNHTGVFERYFYPMCVDCGERFYDEGHWETVTGTSAHYFDFALSSPGVGCMVCGYVPGAEADKFVCEHEETMTQTVSGEEYRPVEGSNAHILTRYTVEQTVCTSNPWRCGQILAEKVISSTPVEGATEEIHTFDAGGVCTVCGYKQLTDPDDPVEPAPTTPAPVVTPAPTTPAPVVTPAPTPRPTMPVVSDVPIDQTPAPTPTPVFTQVPAVETVHGVKAEDEVPMVETLVTVVDTIAKEDASASIQIANVERVVTTEEKQALDTLPVKEQILTFLSVIGFEEQVDAALETTGEALSESAQALKAQIQERIAAMSEEEYAAFEQALLTSFPQQTVEVDGVEYTFFVIELEVRVGDTVRIERYGFRQEDEAWIFTRLEIAE